MGVTPATTGDAAMRRVIEWRENHAAAFARDVTNDPARPAKTSRWEVEFCAASNLCDKDWRQPDEYHSLRRFAEISPKEAREAVSEEQLASMRRLIHQSAYDMWIADDMLVTMLKDALSHQTAQYMQCRDNLKPCSKRKSKTSSQSSRKCSDQSSRKFSDQSSRKCSSQSSKKGSSNVGSSSSSSSISSSPTTTYSRSKDTCCSGSGRSCSSSGSQDASARCRRCSGKAMMSWFSMVRLYKLSAK